MGRNKLYLADVGLHRAAKDRTVRETGRRTSLSARRDSGGDEMLVLPKRKMVAVADTNGRSTKVDQARIALKRFEDGDPLFRWNEFFIKHRRVLRSQIRNCLGHELETTFGAFSIPDREGGESEYYGIGDIQHWRFSAGGSLSRIGWSQTYWEEYFKDQYPQLDLIHDIGHVDDLVRREDANEEEEDNRVFEWIVLLVSSHFLPSNFEEEVRKRMANKTTVAEEGEKNRHLLTVMIDVLRSSLTLSLTAPSEVVESRMQKVRTRIYGGDWLVLGTDGIALSELEIVDIIQKNSDSASRAAHDLVSESDRSGRKNDDRAVVVVRVTTDVREQMLDMRPRRESSPFSSRIVVPPT